MFSAKRILRDHPGVVLTGVEVFGIEDFATEFGAAAMMAASQ